MLGCQWVVAGLAAAWWMAACGPKAAGAPVTVSGIVRDSVSGRPVTNALINLLCGDVQSQFTGADGRYSLSHSPGNCALEASHANYFLLQSAVTLIEGENLEKDLALDPRLGGMGGQVFYRSNGVSFPYIGFQSQTYYPGANAWSLPPSPTNTFFFNSLPDSQTPIRMGTGTNALFYTLEIWNSDIFTYRQTNILVQGGITNSLNIEVKPKYGRIMGELRNAVSQQPIANAILQLWVVTTGPTYLRSEVTDQNGRFVFNQVLDSEYPIHLLGQTNRAQYYLIASRAGYFNHTNSFFELHAPGDTVVDVSLAPSLGALWLTITDELTGERIPSAYVVVNNAQGYAQSGNADTNGQYLAVSLPASFDPAQGQGNGATNAYTAITSRSGYQTKTNTGLLVFGGQTNTVGLTMDLMTARLYGTVRQSGNNALLDGVSITAARQAASGATVYSRTTGTNGTYDFENIPIGNYEVTARKAGFQMATQNLTLTTSGAQANFNLGQAGVIYCRVYDQTDRRPIGGAQLTAVGQVTETGLTETNGIFSFEHLPPGNYNVAVQAAGYVGQSKIAEAVTTATIAPTVFYLVPSSNRATLQVTVFSTLSQPLGGVEVQVESQQLFTDANGACQTTVALGGTYNIWAYKQGYKRAQTTREITAIAENVTFVLEPDPAKLVIEPEPIEFGTVDWGALPFGQPAKVLGMRTAKILNASTFPLTLNELKMVGADAGNFMLGRARYPASRAWLNLDSARYTGAVELPPGASLELEIWLKPAGAPAAGSRFAAFLQATATSPADEEVVRLNRLSAEVGEIKETLELFDANFLTWEPVGGGPQYKLGTSSTLFTENDMAAVTDPDLVRRGYASDGKSRLLLRYRSNSAQTGTVRFSLDMIPALGGSLNVADWGTLSLLGQHVGATQIEVPLADIGPGIVQATAVLSAPEVFPHPTEAAPFFRVTAKFIPAGQSVGEGLGARKKVEVHRAPVVLIHGLWANAKSWGNNQGGMMKKLSDRGYRVATFEYPNTMGPGTTMQPESEHYNRLKRTVQGLINGEVSEGYACARINFVGHSMGGLVSRAFLHEEPDFGRRLITLGTPHLGSGFANLLTQTRLEMINYCSQGRSAYEIVRLLNAISAYTSFSNAGALDNLAMGNPYLQWLNRLSRKTPIFAIVGDTAKENLKGQEYWIVFSINKIIGCSANDLFQGEHSDGIVSVSSAAGGLSPHVLHISGVQHTGMGTDPSIIQAVLEKLESPLSDFAPPQASSLAASLTTPPPILPPNSTDTGNAFTAAAFPTVPPANAGGVTVQLFVSNTNAAPGESLVFTAAVSGGQPDLVLLSDDLGMFVGITNAPYQWTNNVPEISGIIDYRVVALVGSEVVESSLVRVTVRVEISQVTNLVFAPAETLQLFSGSSAQLSVMASLSNGAVAEVTSSVNGTIYSELVVTNLASSPGDSPAIEVAPDGRIIGRQPGEAIVAATLGALRATRQVVVQAISPDDADGDGLTDAQELLIGTQPYNPDSDEDGQRDGAEVGADPAHPLNLAGGAAIDALNPSSQVVAVSSNQILAAVCTNADAFRFSIIDAGRLSDEAGFLARYDMGQAAFHLVFEGVAPGSNVTVTLHYPALAPDERSFLVFGPSAETPALHWFRLLEASVSGSQIVLNVQDNGPGDADPASGVIQILGAVVGRLRVVSLGLSQAGPNLQFSWPAEAIGFQLQASPALGMGWTNVSAAEEILGDLRRIVQPAPPQSTFFRLVKQP